MTNITVGIPRALLYYYYKDLWQSFFEKLKVKTIISPPTNKKIIQNGERYAVDEACLSLKIFLGHINELTTQCDFILVPRMFCIKKKEQVCTNFNALYDLTRNLFPQSKFLNYNVDLTERKTELKGFIHMGEVLGFSYIESYQAYRYAKEVEKKKAQQKILSNNKKLTSTRLKILLAAHPYNLYDSYISKEIIDFCRKEKIDIIYSDGIPSSLIDKECEKISTDIHWTHNKIVMASIKYYQDKVDGIIALSSFPCGPDSLAMEMVKRKTSLPLLYLVYENSNSNEGILTRLESFFDILKAKKEEHYERHH